MAWSPATPVPSTSTRAGRAVPAAVISSGKNRPNVGGPEQRRLVARDVGLRGQRVHGLGARQGARDHVHADRGDAGLREPDGEVGIGQRRRAARRPPGPRAARRPWPRRACPPSARRRRRPALPRGPRRWRRPRRSVVGQPRAVARRRTPAAPRTRPSRSLATASGTSATRRSPGAVSLTTATFMHEPRSGIQGTTGSGARSADRARARAMVPGAARARVRQSGDAASPASSGRND